MLPRDPRKTRRWQRLRLAMLTRFPVCEAVRCHHVATEVHHVRPVQKDPMGEFWFDDAMLRCVCHECHVKEHTEGVEWKPRPKKRDLAI